MKDTSGPAFPNPQHLGMGMTLRQWYAGMALQGMIGVRWTEADLKAIPDEEKNLPIGQLIAKRCFEYADAMLAQDKERTKAEYGKRGEANES